MFKITAQHLFEAIPDYIWITDKNHRYIAGSEKSAKILGFRSLDSMLGLSMYDIPVFRSDESISTLCAQRDYVLKNKQMIDVLDIHPFAGNKIQAHHAKRHPFYDENGELIGVLVIARQIDHSFFSKLILSLSQSDHTFHKKNTVNRSYELISNGIGKLTQRELECYFYLLRGYSARKISDILHRSTRTIEEHINNIKNKMECANKTDLIEKGILSGILYKIPTSLITNLSIVL